MQFLNAVCCLARDDDGNIAKRFHLAAVFAEQADNLHPFFFAASAARRIFGL